MARVDRKPRAGSGESGPGSYGGLADATRADPVTLGLYRAFASHYLWVLGAQEHDRNGDDCVHDRGHGGQDRPGDRGGAEHGQYRGALADPAGRAVCQVPLMACPPAGIWRLPPVADLEHEPVKGAGAEALDAAPALAPWAERRRRGPRSMWPVPLHRWQRPNRRQAQEPSHTAERRWRPGRG